MNQRHLCKSLLIALSLLLAAALHAADGPGLSLHLSPAGNDANPGTAAKPLATLAAAERAARSAVGKKPVTVWLHAGTYYLPETVRFTAEDSGTAKAPVVYAAAPDEQPVISGGARLQLDWKPFRDGVFQAKTPAGLAMDKHVAPTELACAPVSNSRRGGRGRASLCFQMVQERLTQGTRTWGKGSMLQTCYNA